jgi:hypothetical protein
MSKIPELMSGRKLEHSANVIGNITTQRGVVAGPAAKVGGQIGNSQLIAFNATAGTDIASVTLPVGCLTAGTVLRVKAVGVNSAGAGTVNLTLAFRLAGVPLFTVAADPAQNEVICFCADIHVGSVGATGVVSGSGIAKIGGALQPGTAATNTVNTAVSNPLTLRAQWAAGGETITFTNISFEIVGG